VKSIGALDRAAADALAAVDESVASQLRALAALSALAAAAQAAQKKRTSVVAAEVLRLLDERRDAFRRFHLDRVERAVDLVRLRGESERPAALAVVDDAIAFVSAAGGDASGEASGELRGLRVRKSSLAAGGAGKAVPFFARFLEHQKR
jgi:hypothetical protein